MSRTFRFGVVSDPHIALPETIWENPTRFHMVEVSIPAFEFVLAELATADLDFLLLPGDLTQHGERPNHRWLARRLAELPYPVYVVPGNHDVLMQQGCDRTLSLESFAHTYGLHGYGASPQQPYYAQEILPQVWLIGLNSIAFDGAGAQLPYGLIDPAQLAWLRQTLDALSMLQPTPLVMVMVHHNVLEHLPGQRQHSMGKRYILQNADALIQCLQAAAVSVIFTGHLHIQDVVQHQSLWEVTTGSLVSYPHPYRVVQATQTEANTWTLAVETGRIASLPSWENLAELSREWMGDRSLHFMQRFLTEPPISAPPHQAAQIAPHLRYFWADIAAGDALFDFSHLPASIHQYLRSYGALDAAGTPRLIDNQTVLHLAPPIL